MATMQQLGLFDTESHLYEPYQFHMPSEARLHNAIFNSLSRPLSSLSKYSSSSSSPKKPSQSKSPSGVGDAHGGRVGVKFSSISPDHSTPAVPQSQPVSSIPRAKVPETDERSPVSEADRSLRSVSIHSPPSSPVIITNNERGQQEEMGLFGRRSSAAEGSVKIRWSHFGQKHNLYLPRSNGVGSLYNELMGQVTALHPEFKGQLAYKDVLNGEISIDSDESLRRALQQSGKPLKVHTTLTGTANRSLSGLDMAPSRMGSSVLNYARSQSTPPRHKHAIGDGNSDEVYYAPTTNRAALQPYSQPLLYGMPPSNLMLSHLYYPGGTLLSVPVVRHGRRSAWCMGAPRCWMVGPYKYGNWAGMGGIGGPYSRCFYGPAGGWGSMW